MSAKYCDRPQDRVLARQVTETCFFSYRHSSTGLGPGNIQFSALSSDGKMFKVDPDTFYSRYVPAQEYILRPSTCSAQFFFLGDKLTLRHDSP